MMLTRVSTIFPYLLITLLCVGGVELFYRGVERFLLKPVNIEQHVAEEVAEPEIGVAMPKRTVDYSIITSRNLFGPPPEETTDAESEEALDDEELEPTTLDVVLMGTIDGTEQGSRAIILNKNDRKQELYQVGDTVEGALVKEIQRGKVILSVNGRDEMLDMSEAAQYNQGSPQAVTTPAMVRRKANLRPSRQITSGDGQETVSRPRPVQPSRRVVRPRNVDPADAAAEAPPDFEEEPLPDVPEEQEIQEPVDNEQGALDQREIQDENVEEPTVE
jgi:hypothetical protein